MTTEIDDRELWISARLPMVRVELAETVGFDLAHTPDMESVALRIAVADWRMVALRRQVEELGGTPRA